MERKKNARKCVSINSLKQSQRQFVKSKAYTKSCWIIERRNYIKIHVDRYRYSIYLIRRNVKR